MRLDVLLMNVFVIIVILLQPIACEGAVFCLEVDHHAGCVQRQSRAALAIVDALLMDVSRGLRAAVDTYR